MSGTPFEMSIMAKQGLQQVFDSSVIERTELMNEMNAMTRIGGY